MELNISAQAAARLAPLLRADRVLILDLNDGIGPYSRSYHDPTQAKFSLLVMCQMYLMRTLIPQSDRC